MSKLMQTEDGTRLNLDFVVAISPVEKIYNAKVKNEDGSHKKEEEITEDMIAGYFFSVQFTSGYNHSFPFQTTMYDSAKNTELAAQNYLKKVVDLIEA